MRALVEGAPLPDGFDAHRVGTTARALARKRYGDAARLWPELLAHRDAYVAWAADHPTRGTWQDVWDFARAHRDSLDAPARAALAVREALWRYGDAPRPRRLPTLRLYPRGVVVAAFGRARLLGRR